MLIDTKALVSDQPARDFALLDQSIVALIAVFGCFYLVEKGIGGWTGFLVGHWRIPPLETSRWLTYNLVHELVLMAAFLAYRRNRERWLWLGLGVLLWGAFSALFHLTLSIGYREYAPGLLTAVFGFIPLCWLGLRRARSMGRLSIPVTALSLVTGLLLFFVPYLVVIRLAK